MDRPTDTAEVGIVVHAAVLLAGLALAWMDTRPSWDDTGVTAAGLLIIAALGALAGIKPWLSALLVVAPLLVVETSGSVGVLMAALFPLVGAYAGWLVRRRVWRR